MASHVNNKAAARLEQTSNHLTLNAEPTNTTQSIPNVVPPPIDYPKPKGDIKIDPNRFIDDVRELKVAVVGAGLAGVTSGILLPIKVPSIKLTIYEKNTDVSGTWLENSYPGVRCDIPAHAYQSTFSPNTQWSEIFAKGSEIRDYWQSVARKYDVYKYTKLGHKVEEAIWDDNDSLWTVRVYDLNSGKMIVERFDFVILAIGRFNDWKLPDYPGIGDYKGHLRHTSNWDCSFDPTGKKVAVIGNGASGIQIVPNLQLVAKHVANFARNPTWVAASFAGDERTFEPQPYTEEEKESFKDPLKYQAFRKDLESKYWRRVRAMYRGTPENAEMREIFTEIMKRRTKYKPDVLKDWIPDFSPNCRRLTPGPGYLEALSKPNTDLIKTRIKRFTKTGIETEDGVHREFDAIFCATGANIDLVPPFPIRARELDLKRDWAKGGKWGFPYSYIGVATPGFPNLLHLGGPHATGPSGTVPHSIEVQLAYHAKVLRKVSSQGIRSIVPSTQAADDYTDYCDAYYPTTVLTDNCSSWNNGGKPGGRIHGLWPGSAAQLTIIRRDPRWEDWEYVRDSKSGNRFEYFGNGHTRKELDVTTDITSYLKLPSEIDLRDVHESWWDLPG